ncbi:CaiB/BaiF CoA transferase family protein, partial [Chloroflexota bacterium]
FRGFGVQGASLAGFWGVTGYPGGSPTGLYGPYCDLLAHRYLMIAILMALEYKRRTGKGQYIDQSQAESGIHFLAPALLDYMVNGRVWGPSGNRNPSAVPHNAYRCQGNDSWCVIAISTDEEWEAFTKAIGQPDWIQDPKFATFLKRKENEEELDKLVEQWTINNPAEEVMYHLQKAGVPAGIVSKAQDLHQDPQLKHRNHFWILEHPVIGRHTYDAPAFRLSEAPAEPRMPAPCLGQHNELVCRQILGLSDDEIAQLLAQGVLE